MDSTDDSDSVRTITGGAYQFLLPLAEGGMGRVDVVVRHDGQFRRLYALKRLHAQYRSDEAFRAMFLDEARIAGLLRHPNAVSVLDVGEDDYGPFLVMDYVDGVPLSAILKRVRRGGEHVPVQLIVNMVGQAARGLHAAHELQNYDGTPLGLVHRDVSPQNILVSYNGAVQMTDFGVAKALGRLTKTQSGVLKGKYGYMSPEQLRFQDIDRRSDVFALGVVLFELLAGRRLYGAGDTPAPRRILEEAPPDVGEERDHLMPELVELCFELLAKDPEARPKTAKNVAERLDEIGQALALEEGKVDLATYMLATFGDVRIAAQKRIEATIATLAAAPPTAHGSAVVGVPVAPRSRRPLLIAVAALCLAAGVGASFFLRDDAPVETSAWESAPPPPQEPVDSMGLAPPAPTPIEALPLRPLPAEVPVEPSEPEPSVPVVTMRRRRANMRPRMDSTPSMRSVWMWPDDQ
ncbi:MAG: hypothetical protein ACI9KE_005544 [Polyangiales bacterium]|jgi:hypothetical protein